MKSLHKILALGVALAAGALSGCISSSDSSDDSTNAAAMRSQSGQSSTISFAGKGVTKVDVCHIPPGNPANMHVITVGSPAVAAHLAHGDKLGACTDVPPTDTIPNDNVSNPPHDDVPPADDAPTPNNT